MITMRPLWLAFLLLFAGGFMSYALAEENYETPRYTVVEKQDAFEIRDYAPQLIAEVTVEGDRGDAANKGFRLLADFIFGGNVSKTSVSMTAPVTQSLAVDKKTVEASADKPGSWVVRFMMPSSFTKETLPKPNDDRITIRELAGYRAASVTFTGWWSQSNLEEHVMKLTNWLDDQGIKPTSSPAYAFYNDPFTWPWSRRNEIIVAVGSNARSKNL